MVRVGMADYKVCSSPEQISTLGLGSCVGVVICDSVSRLCGMAHVMLPDSSKIAHNNNRKKFADTCLTDMLQELLSKGAVPSNLYAKVAGGAKMFSFRTQNDMLNIGDQNVEAVHSFLQAHHISIKAEDVGGTCGRTIIFCPEDGSLRIVVVGQEEYVI